MNYLVTGAGGFIGSAIVKKLLMQGNTCTTIDNFSTGTKANVPIGCKLMEGDVADSGVVGQLMDERYDAVIHIAGQSSGEVSFENPIYDLNTNTKSTLLLLDLAKKTKVKKFIYASSMSVYGEQGDGFVDEATATQPKSFYAVGKLASESYMRIYSDFGIQCTALRFFNVYGIGQNMGNLKQGMFSIYLAQAINNHHIVIKGAKDRYRDFVYIEDVVDSVLAALGRTVGNAFEVYNVCSGERRTVEELVQTIRHKLPYEVTAEYVEGTPGDQHGIHGSYQKISDMLGWKPRISFDEGTTRMIDWATGL